MIVALKLDLLLDDYCCTKARVHNLFVVLVLLRMILLICLSRVELIFPGSVGSDLFKFLVHLLLSDMFG